MRTVLRVLFLMTGRSRVTDEVAFNKPAVETKDGDSAILKVIEAYVNAGKASRASRKSPCLEKCTLVRPSACAQGHAQLFESGFARAACGAFPPTYGYR